jgi:glycosyltransferase involved in cell wall biosynthesis
MPESPSLTLAIPFYRNLAYLEATLASVLAQDRGDWQAVVVDDASPEPGAAELVASLGDERIRSVRNDVNLGLAGAFNRCLDVAETDLVTILHADDLLLPCYVDVMAHAHDAYPEAMATHCRARVIGAHGRTVVSVADRVKRVLEPRSSGLAPLQGEDGLRRVMRGNFIMCPTVCYRRSRLGALRFDARWRQVLDLDLYARMFLAGGVVVGVPDTCYAYRRHPEQQTAELTGSAARFAEELALFDEIADTITAAGWDRAAATARHKRVVKLHLGYRLAGDVLHGRWIAARAKRDLLLSRRPPDAPAT